VTTKRIKYRYLAAWDEMMASSPGWAARNQEFAEEDGAPIDAVYWNDALGGGRKWRRFVDVSSERTRDVIAQLLKKGESA